MECPLQFPISTQKSLESQRIMPPIFILIKRDLPLRGLKLAYCVRLGLEIDAVRFTYDGVKIGDNETADELKMEDGHVIDAWSDQSGGGRGGGDASNNIDTGRTYMNTSKSLETTPLMPSMLEDCHSYWPLV
ncbi:hypothetical protein ACSBR2_030033 [Camellia fascicularis]